MPRKWWQKPRRIRMRQYGRSLRRPYIRWGCPCCHSETDGKSKARQEERKIIDEQMDEVKGAD